MREVDRLLREFRARMAASVQGFAAERARAVVEPRPAPARKPPRAPVPQRREPAAPPPPARRRRRGRKPRPLHLDAPATPRAFCPVGFGWGTVKPALTVPASPVADASRPERRRRRSFGAVKPDWGTFTARWMEGGKRRGRRGFPTRAAAAAFLDERGEQLWRAANPVVPAAPDIFPNLPTSVVKPAESLKMVHPFHPTSTPAEDNSSSFPPSNEAPKEEAPPPPSPEYSLAPAARAAQTPLPPAAAPPDPAPAEPPRAPAPPRPYVRRRLVDFTAEETAALNGRELAVARLLLDGAATAAIAAQLGIQASVVRVYALRARRHMARAREVAEALPSPAAASDAALEPSPGPAPRRRARIRFAAEDLELLTGREREVAALRLEGLPPAAISERTGISQSMVATYACRAHRRLRETRGELLTTTDPSASQGIPTNPTPAGENIPHPPPQRSPSETDGGACKTTAEVDEKYSAPVVEPDGSLWAVRWWRGGFERRRSFGAREDAEGFAASRRSHQVARAPAVLIGPGNAARAQAVGGGAAAANDTSGRPAPAPNDGIEPVCQAAPALSSSVPFVKQPPLDVWAVSGPSPWAPGPPPPEPFRPEDLERIGKREGAIVRLLLRGLSEREVAVKLGLDLVHMRVTLYRARQRLRRPAPQPIKNRQHASFLEEARQRAAEIAQVASAEDDAEPEQPARRRERSCRRCGQPGHNARTCDVQLDPAERLLMIEAAWDRLQRRAAGAPAAPPSSPPAPAPAAPPPTDTESPDPVQVAPGLPEEIDFAEFLDPEAPAAAPEPIAPAAPTDAAAVDDEQYSDDALPTIERARARAGDTMLGRPRGITIAARPLLREEKRSAALVLYPEDVQRPRTRGECVDQPRPCPWVSCPHHLYLDVNPTTGAMKLAFPHLEVDEIPETCTLDVADRGGVTLDEVGKILNLTRERIRQVEMHAVARAAEEMPKSAA